MIETKRCEVCDWPLAATMEEGCVEGNCSYRPHEGTSEYFRIRKRRQELAAKPAEPSPEVKQELCATKYCGKPIMQTVSGQWVHVEGREPACDRHVYNLATPRPSPEVAPTRQTECECGRVGYFNGHHRCTCPCHVPAVAPRETQPEPEKLNCYGLTPAEWDAVCEANSNIHFKLIEVSPGEDAYDEESLILAEGLVGIWKRAKEAR